MTLTSKDKETVKEIVRNELAEQQAEQQSYEEDVEDRARSTLVMTDIQHAEQHGLTAAETLLERYGIDATDYPDENALLADVRAARSESA